MVQDIARERVLHNLLERQAKKYGRRTYMYYEEKKFSFEEMNQRANQVAGGLQKLGVHKGDKVAVVMENCPEVIFLMFGLSKVGAVVVPINIYHKGDIMAYMVDHSDSSVLVMHSQFIDRLEMVLKETSTIHTVVILEGGGEERTPESSVSNLVAIAEQIGGFGKRLVQWPDFIDNDGQYLHTNVIFSDPIMILYTSGTTGPSKGVLLPQNLVYSQAEHFYTWTLEFDLDEEDCIYNPSPLCHAQAWHAGVNLSLLRGARMVLKKKFSARSHWDDVKRFGCTHSTAFGAANSILLLAEPKPDDADNPLRVVLGGPASKKLCREYEARFGAKILEFYGSTELGAPARNKISDFKPGTCGKRHPDYVIKIVDEDGIEVGVNTPGEILVRPLKQSLMMLEYYKMPEKTAEAWKDLWFHTGDCGYFDDDGFLHFSDRKKDSLRRRGENISSFEVEKAVNSHPAVRESAVFGVRSDFGDDDVMLCLALKPGEILPPGELIAYCEERMAYFMVPRYVRYMEDLPKNAVLRVEKYKLREEGVTPDTWDLEKSGYKLKR